jgi:DNA-binding response OmpR family regulator
MDSSALSPLRILIVEPDVSLQALLCETLSEEGYAVSLASSLEKAPAQLEKETFALVLANVFVGRYHAGSFTPAHWLRRLAHPTPVGLLMTVPLSPEEAAHAGFAFVLPMPYDLEDLLALVAATIQQPPGAEYQQHVRVVERYFAAREQEDWQAMLDLCTEDVVFSPLGASSMMAARQIRGQMALRGYLASAARSVRFQTFMHFYYAALPKGLIVRYVCLWTTPEEERRREAKIALFHFRGERISQIGMRPLLVHHQEQAQAG